ncbi:MAG: response regulator [Thermodesulfobacteriota bacterium]|nr:response regulator [Thermodesulfobacteriota bacterium]
MGSQSLVEGKKILVVDDESDIMEALRDLLPMCELAGASTFEGGKELLENQYFDIAILDIMGVRGYDLLSVAKTKNIIPIMLTAHALSPENTVKSYEKGAASYIPKEEISNIETYLNDVLEAKEKGANSWWRWLDRLGDYYVERFGPDWKDKNKEFWNKFPSW